MNTGWRVRVADAVTVLLLASCSRGDVRPRDFEWHSMDSSPGTEGGTAARSAGGTGGETSIDSAAGGTDAAADVSQGGTAGVAWTDASRNPDVSAGDARDGGAASIPDTGGPDASKEQDVAVGPDSRSHDLCGNGQLDPLEECDDPRDFDFDGCTSDCRLTPGLRALLSFERQSGPWVRNAADSGWAQLQLGWGVGLPLDDDELARDPNGAVGDAISLQQSAVYELAWDLWRQTFVDISSLMPPPPDGTVAFWYRAKPVSDEDTHLLVWFGNAGDGWGGTNTSDFTVGIGASGRLMTIIRDEEGAGCEVRVVEQVVWEQWQHAVITYSNLDGARSPGTSSCALYVDGEVMGTDRGLPLRTERMRRGFLGRAATLTNARSFTGAIDEFMMLDTALSAD